MTSSKIWLGVVMLAVTLILILTTLSDAPTYDEPAHIASGLTYAQLSDLRFNSEHPPLIKFLSGLSLRLFYSDFKLNITQQDLQNPHTHVIYDLGRNLFEQNNPTKLLLLSRLPLILLTLLGIFFVYQLTSDILQDQEKGLIASVLFGFEFNVLANGALVTTDMGLLVFWLGTVLFYLRFLFKGRWQNLLFSGLLFGLALLTKYSAVFILPIVFFASLSLAKTVSIKKILISLGVVALIGWVVIWLFYLPFEAPQMLWEELPIVQETIAVKKSETVDALVAVAPLPYYYRYGLKLINHHEAVGQLQYLAGRVGQFNWRWFYPLSFLLKTAEMYLVMFMISIYLVIRQKISNQRLTFLLIMIGLYFLLTIYSGMAFGMRILLPVIGFGAVLTGACTDKIKNTQLRQMLMIFYVLLSIIRFPYFFSSANFFSAVLGSKHEMMIDSNLDWGQDLKRLSSWCREREIDSLAVLANTSLPIEVWGVQSLSLDEAYEQRGYVAVSSTVLNLPIELETEDGEIATLNKPFVFLDDYTVKEKLGSFVIYDLARKK